MATNPVKVGMAPPHPGAFVRDEVVDELGLSVAAPPKSSACAAPILSDLLNAKASISPEMALRIEKAFGVSMDTLLRLQAWHDAHAMRRRADEIDVKRHEPA